MQCKQFGNIRIDVERLRIDFLSMSAHKFYGPKGIGALYAREGANFDRVQDGGHQEKAKRSGTENVAGIVGMAEALKLANINLEENNRRKLENRNFFEGMLKEKIKDIEINGDIEKRLPGNLNVTFNNKEALELLLKLDEYDICASAGSACSTGESRPSHVLTAIGLSPEKAFSTLRFSLGKYNTKEEIDYVVRILEDII